MTESTDNARPWTKTEIEALLAREDFRYQDIPLPFGLSTGGYDRSSTASRIFPDDLSGKTVLDLGCSFGYFCFEAEKRGAARVVGYDVDPDSVRKARLLAAAKGSRVEFETRDLERQPPTEVFDFVLGLNILHHLRNPIGALDALIAATRERLVLEVATVGRHDKKKLDMGVVARNVSKNLPVMIVTRSGTRGKREIQKFYITPTAIENLLIYQRGSFARLDTFDSEHKGRFITIGHKRQIDHILVVSSPTSAGKKTLMRRLTANELPALAERIGTKDASVWGKPLNANRIFEPDEPKRAHLMLHHDFLRPYMRSTMTHERDEANEIIAVAGRRTFVTVWTPPERLIKQITDAEIDNRRKTSKRHVKIRKEYEDSARVVLHYRRWFEYTKTLPGDHLVVTFEGDEMKIMSPEEWERDVAPRFDR